MKEGKGGVRVGSAGQVKERKDGKAQHRQTKSLENSSTMSNLV